MEGRLALVHLWIGDKLRLFAIHCTESDDEKSIREHVEQHWPGHRVKRVVFGHYQPESAP
jgi:hypothetical protein